MSKNIVIIEDEAILRDVLAEKFRNEGFTVHTAADGAEGLALLQQQQPDLVLLDIVMPKRNGYEVLEALAAEQKPLPPIIIISNSGQPVEIDKALGLGAADYIVKAQITPEEVVAKVQKLLEKQPGAKPVSAPQIASTPIAAVSSPVPAEGQRLLLVEDDQFLRELLQAKLKREGFNVRVAVDGREGLRFAENEQPEIVLLDVILPGLDGFAVLQRIRANADPRVAKLPVILLSNLGQDSDVQKGRELGATDYCIKANLTPDEIIKKIRQVLAAKPR